MASTEGPSARDHGAESIADPGLWEAWMVRAQAGDGAAYRQLLLAALPLLRDVAGRHCADPAAAERLVGAMVSTVHALRHTYQPGRPVRAWLAGVAELSAATTAAAPTRAAWRRGDPGAGEFSAGPPQGRATTG